MEIIGKSILEVLFVVPIKALVTSGYCSEEVMYYLAVAISGKTIIGLGKLF